MRQRIARRQRLDHELPAAPRTASLASGRLSRSAAKARGEGVKRGTRGDGACNAATVRAGGVGEFRQRVDALAASATACAASRRLT